MTLNDSAPDQKPESLRRLFTTEAQVAYRRGGRKRLAWAVGVAVLGLIAMVLLGPSEDVVKEKFEYYGAPSDEMQIMPEISIDQGADMTHQVPKSLQIPPPPANMDIIEEEDDPDATEAVPLKVENDPNEIDVAVDQPQPDAEVSQDQQVELSMPTQTSTDYFILHMVRPEYPLEATEAERRTPVIYVSLWIFAEPDGSVNTAWVTATNGSQVFSDAVTKAVLQWKIGWRVDEKKGRQIQMTWRFNSPYFTPGNKSP